MDGFFDTIIELLLRYIGQPILFVMEKYVGLFESIFGPRGFMLAFALPIAAGFALIFALKPGQAFIWFRRDLIDGLAVAVRIRYNPDWRSEGSDRRDTYDWRHNSVIIEVPTPADPAATSTSRWNRRISRRRFADRYISGHSTKFATA